ncbi:MAG: EAL domain-containing protein, partial [SAR324 cluster bacterium]|nr:EAL domain-containing protein [SAR324 cluster bacterium]
QLVMDTLLHKENLASVDILKPAIAKVIDSKILGEVELKAGSKVFHFEIAPVADNKLAHLYGKEISDKRAYQDQLALQAQIMDYMHEGVALTRISDGVIVFANPVFEENFGYEPGEMIGMTPDKLNAPTIREPKEMAQEVMTALSTKGVWKGEVHNIKKDGSYFWGDYKLTTFDHPIHGLVGVGVTSDITETKKAKESLIRAKDEAQLYFDMAGTILIVINTENKVELINQKGCEVLGYSKNEIVGLNWFENFIPERFRAMMKSVSEQVLRGEVEAFTEFENLILTKSGEERLISWHNAELLDEQGNVRASLSSGTDVTDQEAYATALQESADRLKEAQRISKIGSWNWDILNNKLNWSDEIFRVFGHEPQEFEVNFDSFITRVLPEDRDKVTEAVQGALEGKEYAFTHRLVRPSGEVRVVRAKGEVVINAEGEPSLFNGTVQDVTDQAQAKDQIDLMVEVFRNTSESIVITDENNNIIQANKAYEMVTGYSLQETLGKNPKVQKSGRHDKTFYKKMWERILTKGSWEGEIWDRRKNGEIYPKYLSISTFENQTSGKLNYVGIFSDITEKKRAEEELKQLAYYDALTGLSNRGFFLERLNDALAQCKRKKGKLALLFLDLDNFKGINDSMGHQTGDQMLVHVAKVLTEMVRDTDIIGRFGGDEFVIALTDVGSPAKADHLATQLCSRLAEGCEIGGEQVFSGVSVGISFYPDDGETPAELLRKGDTAMYHSKGKGKGQTSFYDSNMEENVSRKHAIDHALHYALEEHQLYLAYQPQVDARTGEILGLEALIRWNHPELGKISPTEFIPIAEESGLILSIGQWVLEEACRQNKAWQVMGLKPVVMSVNFSARQFGHAQIIQQISGALEATGLEAKWFKAEITEGLLMEDVDQAIETLNILKSIGVRSSIDDFGTGYSSLNYLAKFPISDLKIDRAFVDGILDDSNIADAVIRLAQGMGLEVIAEGAEDSAQVERLKELGCFFVQGFYFSRPLNSFDVQKLLEVGSIFPK